MSLSLHYLQTATKICSSYDGQTPFNIYIKDFFSRHRKYGSRDRKHITHLCYCFFRLGKAGNDMPADQKIVLGLFLTSFQPNSLLAQLNAAWNLVADQTLNKKLALAGHPFSVADIAPLESHLSKSFSAINYATHFLLQPDLFIRIRPGHSERVIHQLDLLGWTYTIEGESAVRLPPSSAVEKHFPVNRQLVIQDFNSQRIGRFVRQVFEHENFVPESMWDCCAASGGKSIMMKDIYPQLRLTVSDIRPSILQNLQRRFKEAGITKYQSFVVDLQAVASNSIPISNQPFIFADVPCTGSGTWSRTPEQLYLFDESTIDEYAIKQFGIVSALIPYLNKGGYLVYATCSVFKKENEEIMDRITKHHALRLIDSILLDGTMEKADSMFVAILKKSIE